MASTKCIEVTVSGSAQLDNFARNAFESLQYHLRQGRSGRTWCRWSVQAFDLGTFYVADGRECGGRMSFVDFVTRVADAFVELCMPNGDCIEINSHSNSLTVLCCKDSSYEELDKILQDQRANLLRRGLMVALLHPQSTRKPLSPGPPGAPYRTEHPFLTVRWATPGDELFVATNPQLHALLQEWLAQ